MLSRQSKVMFKNGDLVALLCYFLFCCFFYLERTTFLDNPFSIFKLINDETSFVNANRYPAIIMQLLPLLAIKIGAPLKMVLFMHSFGYFLFHSLIFIIIRNRLKDKVISTLLLATLIIPVAHTFFWNNNELFLGLSAICLWIALMRKGQLVSSIVTAIVLAWIHPLLFVIVLYLTAISTATKGLPYKMLIPNVLLYLGSYFAKSIFFPNYYDTNKNELLINNLMNYDFAPSSIFELISSLAYWPIILCSMAVIALLLMNKKWLLTILLVGFIFCYLLLTALTEGNPFYVFYNEGNFRVLFFVAGLTLISSSLYKKQDWINYGVGLLILIGFIRIAYQSSFYTERIQWYQNLTAEHDRELLTYGNETKQRLIQSWASPFESIIISSLDGDSRTLILTEDAGSIDTKELKANMQMITTHGRFLIYNTDNQYFTLKDKRYKLSYLD